MKKSIYISFLFLTALAYINVIEKYNKGQFKDKNTKRVPASTIELKKKKECKHIPPISDIHSLDQECKL